MPVSLRVLILEDRAADAELMLEELRQAGFEPVWERVETEADYLARLDPGLDVILADYHLPQFDATRALEHLQARGLDIPFVVLSGAISEEVAVECMKHGAADYLLKDRLARLGPAVRQALERKHLRDERQRQEAHTRRAEEASRLKSAFLANMSHELRTPLTAVIGFAQLMHEGRAGPLTTEQGQLLADILAASRHLLRLIDDVLDLSKVEAGKLDFRPEPVDPAALVGEVRDSLRTLAGARRIPIAVEIAPDLDPVVADPGRLKQVLYNYLSNALKFTPEGGRVTVRVGPAGPEIFSIEVEDTGVGVAPEDLDRLFVEFQQLDAATGRVQPGTGLGLALVRRLVEAQGGEVGVRSTPGQGSVFFAVLPRRPAGGLGVR
jgi:signal transduction histidine kinase